MLSRKQVVETLQANRSEAVHLLDQLVRQLPDGIYLRSIKQDGTKVTMTGYAQSNARVSTLMRNIEASPWIANPELVEIRLVPTPGAPKDREAKISEFTLIFHVKRAAPIEAKATPGAPGSPGTAPAKAPPPPPKAAAPERSKPA